MRVEAAAATHQRQEGLQCEHQEAKPLAAGAASQHDHWVAAPQSVVWVAVALVAAQMPLQGAKRRLPARRQHHERARARPEASVVSSPLPTLSVG